MAHGASIAAMIIFAIGLIVQIVAVATTGWVYVLTGDERYHYNRDGDISGEYGLFQVCISYEGYRYCFRIDSAHSLYDWPWLKAVQALEIIGVIGYALCITVLLVMLCAKIVKLKILVGVVGILTGIFIAIGVGVVAAKYPEEFYRYGAIDDIEEHLHYSFYLACVAAFLAIVAGIVAFVIKEKFNATPQQPTNVIVMQAPAQPYGQQVIYTVPPSPGASQQYVYPAAQAPQYLYNPNPQKY